MTSVNKPENSQEGSRTECIRVRLTPYPCIQKVRGLKLGQDISYHDSGFCGDTHGSGQFWDSTCRQATVASFHFHNGYVSVGCVTTVTKKKTSVLGVR